MRESIAAQIHAHTPKSLAGMPGASIAEVSNRNSNDLHQCEIPHVVYEIIEFAMLAWIWGGLRNCA
jgi:hypothetical protein